MAYWQNELSCDPLNPCYQQTANHMRYFHTESIFTIKVAYIWEGTSIDSYISLMYH